MGAGKSAGRRTALDPFTHSPVLLRLSWGAASVPRSPPPPLRSASPPPSASLSPPLGQRVSARPGPARRLFVNEMLSFSMEPRGAPADAAQAAALALSREEDAFPSLARARPPSRRRGF